MTDPSQMADLEQMSPEERETYFAQMSPEEKKAYSAAMEAKAREVLAEDSELEAAANHLEECIDKFEELNEEILPAQSKGIIIPNAEQRIYTAQSRLAEGLDKLTAAMKASDNRGAIGVAMQMHSIGVQYFQGIYFGIQYSAIQLKCQGDRPFQRLLHQGYKMVERAQQSAVAGNAPKPGIITP